MTTVTTMQINTAIMGLFKKKVEKANKKAAKHGLPPVDVIYGATAEQRCGSDTIGAYQVKDEKGINVWVSLYTDISLIGQAPVIEGYRFVATVDLMGDKPMVKRQPYASDADLSRFFETDCHCDHCNTNRSRKDVLVVENVETGALLQIGRSCAADFFRSKDAVSLLACSDWLGSYGNITDTEVRYEGTVALRRIYEVAAAVVRTFGWVHQKDVSYDNTLMSTKTRVWNNLFPWSTMPAEDRVRVTAEDEAEAVVVMQWLQDRFLSKDPKASNDFERNVQAAVEGQDSVPYVRNSNLNFVIWGIAGYKRDLQKDAEDRRRKAELAKQVAVSDFVGTVGDRRDFVLTLTFKRAFGSDFGVKYMQKFVDQDGKVFVWWGTNDVAQNTIVGNTYTFKATIKAHEVYGEMKQTVITRAALLEGELKASE